MKRFFALLLMAVLALSLAACGKEPEPLPQPEPVVTSTELQGEIYCIPLEYNRLYLQGSDELEYPTLTVDSYCYAYSHRGSEVVAAFADHTIRRFDLTDGSSEILVEDTEGYIPRLLHYCDDGFLYLAYDKNNEVNVYRWHEGQVKQLVEDSYSIYDLFVLDGTLVYNEYNYDMDRHELVALNIADGTERWRVVPDWDTFYLYYQQDDTVYLNCNDAQLCRVEMADGALTPLEVPFDTQRFDILAIGSNGSFLLNDYGYLSGEPGVYYMDEDGMHLLDWIPVDTESSSAIKLDQVGDKVLVKSVQYQSGVNRDGEDYYYSSSFYHVVDMTDGDCAVMFVPRSENARLFEYGDFPVLDSSTARKPVTWSIYNLFCLDSGCGGTEPVCNTTHGAWLALADRTSDIALLAAPTEEEQAYLNEKGVEVEMKLYGGDGLVFIGNDACGVKDLTLEQVRAIYRGEITNWSELGGADAPIRVLYRDDQSGSQRLFERMVWGDEEVPDYEALGFERLDEMSTIVGECLYEPYSIGYSIMTYLNDIYGEEELLAFSLNGVSATPENVAAGKYALGTKGYVVIRADEAVDSPARRLYNWFGSAISDEILRNNGITPLHE